MTETNICSEESTSGPKRSLGTTPTLLVALLQRFQSVGLDQCGWVGGWVAFTESDRRLRVRLVGSR